MKIINRYLSKLGALSILAVLAVSCATFEDYESAVLPAAPTVSLQLVSSADSSITVSITSSLAGYIGVDVLAGTGNDLPDTKALLTGNVAAIDFVSQKVEANTPFTVTFYDMGIEQASSYEVMAVAANSDGVISEVSVLEVQTGDTYGPNPLGSDPAPTYDQVYTPGDPIVLYFDEPVVVDPTKNFTFETYFTGLSFGVDSAIADGNMVTLYPAEEVPYGDYFQLSYEEGVVSDHSGNVTAGLTSSIDDGIGFLWRAYKVVMDAVVTPAEGSQPADFAVTLTFDDFVDFSGDYVEGVIAFVYYTSEGENKLYVPTANITINDNVVTIVQPTVPASGTEVELTIPQGTFSVGVFNPSGEVSASWLVQ